MDSGYLFLKMHLISLMPLKSKIEIIQLQEQGIGVPLFKAVTSYIPLATKFITFRRYVPTNLHPFDIDKDYYDYCIVKRKLHVGYDSYIFEFTLI